MIQGEVVINQVHGKLAGGRDGGLRARLVEHAGRVHIGTRPPPSRHNRVALDGEVALVAGFVDGVNAVLAGVDVNANGSGVVGGCAYRVA